METRVDQQVAIRSQLASKSAVYYVYFYLVCRSGWRHASPLGEPNQ